jgi:late competence protein required for DNA uptake (superfamily II DNA/RNA helicase)
MKRAPESTLKRMGEHALFCPRCQSSDIHPYVGGISGAFFCNNCGYLGSLVIEKDFVKTMKSDVKMGLQKK